MVLIEWQHASSKNKRKKERKTVIKRNNFYKTRMHAYIQNTERERERERETDMKSNSWKTEKKT